MGASLWRFGDIKTEILPLIMHSFSLTFADIAMNDRLDSLSLKIRFL